MAQEYKIRYKNYCTPQEQIMTNGRWYLDSDCGRNLAGDADISATLSGTGTLTPGVSISSTAEEIVTAASDADFVYIKNTGSTDILITLDNSNYLILLSEGEAFASEIHINSNVKVKTNSGTSTIDHFIEA